MADRGPATIVIGGDLPESKLVEFLKICQDEGGDPYGEWEGPFDIEDREGLEKVIQDGFLEMKDCQAVGAIFYDVEKWLEKNGYGNLTLLLDS